MLNVFCFEHSPAFKGVFLLKRSRHFSFHLRFFYEHVNICIVIVCVYVTVWKTLIFYVECTKKLIFFSLFTSWFFIRNKRHKRRRSFIETGDNSQKQTYVEGGMGAGWGVQAKRTETSKGVGGSKTGSFERTSLLNDP